MALISLDEAKSWLKITDTTRDDILASLVDAASDACVAVLGGRDIQRRKRTEVLSGGGGPTLPVNGYPIRSVEAVTIDAHLGGAPIPATDITFTDYSIVWRSGKFPRGIKNVTAVYSGGLDDVPASVKLAAKFTAKAMWDARLTSMNGTGESWNGVGGESFWPSGPGAVPPQAVSLLSPYAARAKVT